jgi:hypothetical protein
LASYQVQARANFPVEIESREFSAALEAIASPSLVTILVLDTIKFPDVIPDEVIHPKPGRDFVAIGFPNSEFKALADDQLALPAALISGLPFRYTTPEVTSGTASGGSLSSRWRLGAALLVLGGVVAGWLGAHILRRRTA